METRHRPDVVPLVIAVRCCRYALLLTEVVRSDVRCRRSKTDVRRLDGIVYMWGPARLKCHTEHALAQDTCLQLRVLPLIAACAEDSFRVMASVLVRMVGASINIIINLIT